MSRISRRGFVVASGSAALLAPTLSAQSGAPFAVGTLRVDNLDDPMSLHSGRPRLSWKLSSNRRSTVQTAYRVGVASTRDRATSGQFDRWDSGKIDGSQSFDIRYAGAPLASRDRCFWGVEVWDNFGNHAISAVARWEMGLLQAADWTVPWIGAETGAMADDRRAGLPWLGGEGDSRARREGRSYRLPLALSEAAEIAITVVASRQPEVTIDGVAIALPPRNPNAFGGPPPYRVTIPASRGPHVLAMYVPGDPNAHDDALAPRGAMFVRAAYANGKVARFTGTQARTTVGKAHGWSERTTDDSSWAAAVALPGKSAAAPGSGAFLLRHAFALRQKVRTARLYMAALGSYVPMLNDARVGEQLVAPEWTDFARHALYRAYDVADLVRPGDNVLGAIVGDGWYGSYMAPAGRFGFGDAPLRLRAQLELEFEDGSRATIGSAAWTVSPSAITSSEIYDGEDVDARLHQRNWTKPSFFPSPSERWEPAQVVDTPAIKLLGAFVPPIKPSQTLEPKDIKPMPDGSIVVDFGQNFAGWIRLRLNGSAGQRITMRFAEMLKPDGAVDQASIRAARAADSYILRGDAEGEVFEPVFTYHGFRYVQIHGLSGRLAPTAIDGVVVHSSLPQVGELTLGQHVPQRLWENGLWSQRSNFFGTPTDCPQRDERLGWTGDAHVFWDAACFNMDTAAFSRKFMLDMRDAQRADGSFPDIAPNNDLANFTPPGSSPGWGDAGVFIPWTSWKRHGDTAIIDDHWQAMERFLESIRAPNPDLIWRRARGNDFGDWLSLDGKNPGDPTTPKDLIGTALWKAAADAMIDMATATGRTDAVKRYHDLSASIAKAFNAEYVHADGTVGNGSQTGYILALHFAILPETLRPKATDALVFDIVRRGKLLSTGFLGTPYSLDVLADAGRGELVYDLLLRTAFPSWGYMIAHNATTIWERWNADMEGDSMNSFNHYALGAVSGFMFRRIAGIDPSAAGFARFTFDPVYDARMLKASGRYDSPAGRIATRWERRPEGDFTLAITVPTNSRCSLHLPARTLKQVREQNRPIDRSRDFVRKPDANGRIVLEIGSGDYAFVVTKPAFG